MSALVSVVIPAFNVAPYIRACLQSILHQTYTHLEVLVVNDAATDDTLRVVQQFRDPRIRIIQNETNLGLAASVNKAILGAGGVYIARMDADDVAHHERIQKQVDFLEAHPEVSVVGAAMRSIGYSRFVHHFPLTHEACKAQLLFNVCFGHPTVLVRKQVFENPANLYWEELRQYSEEYDLWCRLVEQQKFANLPRVLLDYRTFAPAAKSEAEEQRKINSFLIRKRFISKQWGEQAEQDYVIHDNICNLRRAGNADELHTWLGWLVRCRLLNDEKQAFDANALQYELSKRAFELVYWNRHLGIKALSAWYGKNNPLKAFHPSWIQQTKFVLRTLLSI